jgi:cell division protein FtsW
MLAILFLIGLGVAHVYSASFIFAIEQYNDGLYFFRRQLMFSLLAVATLILGAKLPWRFWPRIGLGVFLLAVIGVGLTYVPGLGVRLGGAHRWLQLPLGLRLEPSEFLKMTFPFVVAFLLHRHNEGKPGAGWFTASVMTALPLFMVLKQPDFGTFVICTLVLFALWFSYGLKWQYVIAGVGVASVAFYSLIIYAPYRMARLQAFLDPWADPEKKGFQVIQSMLSFYSGGVTGAGIGQGQGKLFFLPEAHTDFTLAVLAEETGFFGLLIVLGVYGFIAFRGFQISARTRNLYAQIVALGITITFSLSFIFNAAVAMGLLPTKGLALPFLSYGGSALLANAVALSILLSIDRQSRIIGEKAFNGIRLRK